MDELRQKLVKLLGGKINGRILALTALVFVGVVAILSSLNSPKPYRISTAPPASSISVVNARIYVHVVGLVVHPGIYELDSGARLFQAIFAAGGFAKTADQSSVNLARQLSDGEQVIVTKVGAAGVAGVSGQSTMPAALISLNRGSQAELETLPRVGPALASRLIDWRTANGGFKSKQDLLKVAGIGPKLFAQIEKLVTL